MLIDRYLGSEIARPFFVGLAMLTTIFVAFSTATRLADAASGEIASAVVLQLIFLNTLVSLEVLLPTTLYFAILHAIGRMYRDSEMAALAAAGIGESRVLMTVCKLGLLASIAVALLSIYARPWAYAKTYALEQSSSASFDLMNIPARKFVQVGDDGYVLFAGEVDTASERLRNVFVQVDHPARSQIISAASARMIGMDSEGSRAVEFFNGHAYLLDHNGTRDVDMRFHSLLLRLPVEERISKFRRKAIATGTLRESAEIKDIAEYQWRITTPMATLLQALLAVPLSRANPRQSRLGSLALAMVAYVLIFSASGIVRNWLESGDLDPFPGLLIAYLPSAALLLLLLLTPRFTLRKRR